MEAFHWESLRTLQREPKQTDGTQRYIAAIYAQRTRLFGMTAGWLAAFMMLTGRSDDESEVAILIDALGLGDVFPVGSDGRSAMVNDVAELLEDHGVFESDENGWGYTFEV